MAFYKFEAGICLSYLASNLLIISFKSFLNKKLLKTIYQKSSTLIYALLSFF